MTLNDLATYSSHDRTASLQQLSFTYYIFYIPRYFASY